MPDGFAVTASAFDLLLGAEDLRAKLRALLDPLDRSDVDGLARAGATARALVGGAPMPSTVEAQLREVRGRIRAWYRAGCGTRTCFICSYVCLS